MRRGGRRRRFQLLPKTVVVVAVIDDVNVEVLPPQCIESYETKIVGEPCYDYLTLKLESVCTQNRILRTSRDSDNAITSPTPPASILAYILIVRVF